MTNRSEKSKLHTVVKNFLSGDTIQFEIIKSKISQYVRHQHFGLDIDADEIIGETLHILFKNLRDGKFRGESMAALKVYIYTIVKYRINSVLRERHRFSYTSEQTMRRVCDNNPGPLAFAEMKDLAQKVLELLDSNCRELLRLKFQECWSDQEIADRFKKNKNATSTAISWCLGKARNLQLLKEFM